MYYVYEYIYTYTLKYLCIHIHKDLFLSIVDKGIAEKVGQNISRIMVDAMSFLFISIFFSSLSGIDTCHLL